jgi:hypothetical protein
MVYLGVALSGLTPNPTKPAREFAVLEKAYRRLVFLIALAWLTVVGAGLAYMLYTDKTGWAALLAGVFGVPFLTVPNFLAHLRRLRSRVANPKSPSPE